MTAYGAELILTPEEKGGMEYARDLALQMQSEGRGIVLDQFANFDNPQAHIDGTGVEIWQQTQGQVTHFVSAMGTTGTIMGVGNYLRTKNPQVQVVGAQPAEGAQIAGIRKWPEEYAPQIYDPTQIDAFELIGQQEAEDKIGRASCRERGGRWERCGGWSRARVGSC